MTRPRSCTRRAEPAGDASVDALPWLAGHRRRPRLLRSRRQSRFSACRRLRIPPRAFRRRRRGEPAWPAPWLAAYRGQNKSGAPGLRPRSAPQSSESGPGPRIAGPGGAGAELGARHAPPAPAPPPPLRALPAPSAVRRGGQVVRRRSRKPKIAGSNPSVPAL